MDINSLLSPQESPASETPPPLRQSPMGSPLKRPSRQPAPRRTSSTLSQQITSSPQYHDQIPSSTLPHNSHHTHLAMGAQLPSPGLTSVTSVPNGRSVHSAASTPPIDGRSTISYDTRMTPPQPPLSRHTSTPGMDTLADLATLQQQQQAVKHSASSTLRDSHAHPPPTRPPMTLENLPRNLSSTSAKDLQMAAQDATPRVFKATSLSEEECSELSSAYDVLLKDPTNYWNNSGYINLLYEGFRRHTTGSDTQDAQPPKTYELWSDLYEAFEQIDKVYSFGEDYYCNWIEFKLRNVYNADDRVQERLDIIAFFETKALKDLSHSIKAWFKYGDTLYDWYLAANNLPDLNGELGNWSAQEQFEGKKFFTWARVQAAWQDAEKFTRFRLNDSHLIFDRWMQIQEAQYEASNDSALAASILQQYEVRLTRAHAEWESTRGRYESWVSKLFKNDNETYEMKMENVHSPTSSASRARQAYHYRRRWEESLAELVEASGGVPTPGEYELYRQYLRHEMRKEGIFSFDTITALFDRAVSRFPAQNELWMDYVDYLITKKKVVQTRDILHSAVRHAPWCGALWAHKILQLEIDGAGRNVIESVKNEALRTGVFDVGAIDDLIQLFIAFCGFLRRQAFNSKTATAHNNHAAHADETADEAELAIIAAIEHVTEVGVKQYAKYDQEYPGDPQFRLEKVRIKLLTQQGRFQDARNGWLDLKDKHASKLEFWARWYSWEMVMWPVPVGPASFGILSDRPTEATIVWTSAMENLDTLDQPEQLISMYLQHCEQHEAADAVQKAMVDTRAASRKIAERRAKAAEKVEEPARPIRHQAVSEAPTQPAPEPAQPADEPTQPTVEAPEPPSNGKRKRSSSPSPANPAQNGPKKVKPLQPLSAKERDEALQAGRQVFVRNIPWVGVDLPALAAFLDLPESRIVHKKGWCFGTFDTAEEAQEAVARLNGSDALGRPVAVLVATPGGREQAAGGAAVRGGGRGERGGRGGRGRGRVALRR